MGERVNREDAIGVLDLGASGGRLAVLVQRDNLLHLEQIHRFEHSTIEFWQANRNGDVLARRLGWDLAAIQQSLLRGLRKLADRQDIHLVSFAVDTWGSDGAWVTAEGDLLHPVATGRDSRWREARAELHRTIGDEELFTRTGMQSHSFNVLNQIYWYARHQPRLVDAAATYLPITSLLNYFLTGQRAAEYTWMSTSQLCPAGQQRYDTELLERLQLPREKLPPLLPPGEKLGTCHPQVAEQCGLDRFEVMTTASHDTACAYAAAPLDPARPALIVSTGTWFLVGVLTPRPILTPQAFRAGFSNEGAPQGVRFLKNVLGSWLEQELRRQWTQRDGKELPWETMIQMAASAPPFASALDFADPRLFAPQDMEAALIANCRALGPAPVDRPQMLRTVYEGLAAQVALTVKPVETLTGEKLREIVLVGGGARNALLCQWIADASGLPVRIGHPDATACGNALVQARALGWVRSLSEGVDLMATGSPPRVFQPDPARGWEKLLEKLAHEDNHE